MRRMARSVMIAAYGNPDDRLRLEALARLNDCSQSAWLIEKIRAAYAEIYGDASPKEVVKK